MIASHVNFACQPRQHVFKTISIMIPLYVETTFDWFTRHVSQIPAVTCIGTHLALVLRSLTRLICCCWRVTGRPAHLAACRYCFYSVVHKWVFRSTGVTYCFDKGEIWHRGAEHSHLLVQKCGKTIKIRTFALKIAHTRGDSFTQFSQNSQRLYVYRQPRFFLIWSLWVDRQRHMHFPSTEDFPTNFQ